MSNIVIKYETIEEKEKIIRVLEKEFKIKKISKPYKTGRYNRIYVNI